MGPIPGTKWQRKMANQVQISSNPALNTVALQQASLASECRLAPYMDSSFLQAFSFRLLRSVNAVASIYPACY
jgi:hypothetical protein